MTALIILPVLALPAAAACLALCFFGGTDLHFHRKPDGAKTRIACAGDSITNGAVVGNCFRSAWPARLQRLLGNAYQTENYGLNDRTLQADGDKPYRQEAEYRAGLALDPDIVVVLLGSNDTKPINWKSREHFLAEYRELVRSYQREDKQVRLLLCTPPWAVAPERAIQRFTNDIDCTRLPEIAEAVKETGRESGLPVLDLYACFKGKRELLSFDGLHPNAKGQALIAEQVFGQLRAMQAKG